MFLYWGMMDLTTILIIIKFNDLLYEKRYDRTAYWYIKNQLELLSSYCISILIHLYVYYWIEEKFHFDEQYAKGIILTIFFVLAGYVGRGIYNIFFHSKHRNYKATKEECLVIISTAFIAVTIKMVSEGIIGIAMPFAILAGRLMWIDTNSIKDIMDEIRVRHYRIIEISVFLIIGVSMISYIMYRFQWERCVQPVLAFIYGIFIFFR